MNILYIDTTSSDLVVALIQRDAVKDFSIKNCARGHSEMVCEKVNEAIALCGINFSDIDAYACAVGPGSFTGIRIGISVVKGYKVATRKSSIAVNCLQAISLSERCGERGSAIIDAGNGYYFADFNKDGRPCLIDYNDERAKNAGTASGGLDYLDGAVRIVRENFECKNFCDEIDPIYIRKSQAEITKNITIKS